MPSSRPRSSNPEGGLTMLRTHGTRTQRLKLIFLAVALISAGCSTSGDTPSQPGRTDSSHLLAGTSLLSCVPGAETCTPTPDVCGAHSSAVGDGSCVCNSG